MNVLERALAAVKGEEPDKVPVVLQVYSLVLKQIVGVTEYKYYQNSRLQLKAKIAFQERFPEVLNVGMGMLPEYGEFVGPIPTAFGADLEWTEDAPPYVVNYPIKNAEDVDRLIESGLPDPRVEGVSAEILRRLEYFTENFPTELKERYWYVDGNIQAGAYIEGAALTMGYDKFLIWLRLHPKTLHRWLGFATDWYLEYCKAIEEVVGRCRILWVPDHSPSMVGEEQFREFLLPYLNKVFDKYPKALKIWHNEGSVGHMLDAVDEIRADVWHFGAFDDPVQCKEKTHFCLQGNLHPPWMARNSPQEIEETCRDLILKIAEGGRFWLSTGGGMAPDTPFENIQAIIKAVDTYGKYPIRRGSF